MVTTSHLSVSRGDAKEYQVTVQDSAGTIIDLTNYTAKFTVRLNPLDTTAVIAKTTPSGSGIEITNPTGGILKIILSGTDSTIDPKKYVYDLEITNTGGQPDERYTVLSGNFTITSDVSR